ncbi:MAG: hypothetical protein UR12_C0001G0048 [candidate division TM6 bacterium GW2011_GWF2_30_66]|jgi:3-methyladenine DNA glycosylase AlkD|nr:MAG: hypothetical protein UR12_C0001G0048 [candidate division TM6 bacterium GW2011_GWF2_30_66]
MNKAQELIRVLEQKFIKNSDKDRALQQQRYMKSSMPYYGVTMPQVRAITKGSLKQYAPESNQEYRETLIYIFKNAEYREFWYSGIEYADNFKKFITQENLDVYIEIVRITRWWDIVDYVAANFIGKALIGSENISKISRKLIEDEELWVRRTGLLLQLKYKEKTDFDLLKELVLKMAHEKDFFIRKAIGWMLRQYSYVDPDSVKSFIEENRDKLSGLSIREGLRVINKQNL